MPYTLEKSGCPAGKPFAVKKQPKPGAKGTTVVACHATRADALKHMRALYANVPDARAMLELDGEIEAEERAANAHLMRDLVSGTSTELGRTFTAAERKKAASSGASLPDGSYPIYNCQDVNNAVQAIGRGNASATAVRAHITKRAKSLGCPLPQSWQ